MCFAKGVGNVKFKPSFVSHYIIGYHLYITIYLHNMDYQLWIIDVNMPLK